MKVWDRAIINSRPLDMQLDSLPTALWGLVSLVITMDSIDNAGFHLLQLLFITMKSIYYHGLYSINYYGLTGSVGNRSYLFSKDDIQQIFFFGMKTLN